MSSVQQSVVLPRLAIFDCNYAASRWFAWAARQVGVAVKAYAPQRMSIGRFSRYLPRPQPCPSFDHADAFAQWARDAMAQGEFDLIAPTSDRAVYFGSLLNTTRAEDWTRRLPAADDLQACLFKDRFFHHCRSAGVPAPRTATAESLDGLIDQVRNEVGFPAVIKPRSHVQLANDRGSVATSVDALHSKLNAHQALANVAGGFAGHSPLPIVQQYLPAAATQCMSVCGLIDARRETSALSANRKLASTPPVTGVGMLFEAIHDPQLLKIGSNAAARLLTNSLFELELIPDPDSNALLAIDLNPRAYGQMELAIANGHVLPRLWLQYVLGLPLTPPPAIDSPVDLALHPVYARLARLRPRADDCFSALRGRKFVSLGMVPGDRSGNAAYVLRALRMARGMLA